jgi:hypothetical protein
VSEDSPPPETPENEPPQGGRPGDEPRGDRPPAADDQPAPQPETPPPGETQPGTSSDSGGEGPSPDGETGADDATAPQVTDEKEESLDYDDDRSRWVRQDIGHVGSIGHLAGRDIINHFRLHPEKRAPGPIGVADLDRAARVHVTTESDAWLQRSVRIDRVVFLRGRTGTGRRASATVVLDRLTGMSRPASKVIVLDTLTDRLEPDCGHLLDGSDEAWVDTITEAQLAGARADLGRSGFLIILVDAGSARSLPGPVVDHDPPDLGQVLAFQLAARLTTKGALDTSPAQALIDEACRLDPATRQWHQEITEAAAPVVAEAALFAEAVWDWQRRRASDHTAAPRVGDFRDRRRYQQAANLLRRRGDGADSPLRQSYAISAAVLDGLAVSEVIEGAGRLSALLAEVEHPGAPGHREIFGQPLTRWLGHVEMAVPPAGQGSRDGTVVKMPSRELSRIVIEVAWQSYDAARPPLLEWLMSLCQQHPDERVRIRAAQALAVIAQHDYGLIKDRVLEPWSASNLRIQLQAAAWLLEAMVLEGTVAEQVKVLLRRWARSGDVLKRAVAVRTYGTAVAKTEPADAVQGVRLSAADPLLSTLPELALREMYLLGLTREVVAELLLWARGFRLMRERAGRTLVLISRIRRVGDGRSPGPHDLLWRLAHAPGELDAGVTEVAALWHLACKHPAFRGPAWQTLGQWAQSCRDRPRLRDTFTQLADEFEKAADTDEFRARLGVYRRRWTAYFDEGNQT